MKLLDESIEYLIDLAVEAVHEGDYLRARKLIDSGLMQEPGYPKLHSTLAWMYHYYQEDKEQAERHYLLAIYFDPENEYAWNGLIELALAHKKYDLLKERLLKARENHQLDEELVYGTLGKIAERQNRFAEAMVYYRKALMVSTDNDQSDELKKDVKRTRRKRFKTLFKWQRQN